MTSDSSSNDHGWFKQLFALSPDPTWIIEDNRFVECNESAVRTLGFSSRDALLNIHPSELSPPTQPCGEDSYVKAERMMAMAMEKGLHRFEWIHTKADGSDFVAEVTLSAIELQGRQVIYCVWRDITKRKLSEEALRQNVAHMGTLLNTIPDLVWLKDAQGVYLNCNRGFERFMGRKEDDIVGKTAYDLVSEERARFYESRDQAVIDSGKPIRYEDEIAFGDDGHIETVEITKAPIFDTESNIVGMLGIAHDITERKRRLEELKQHRHHLEELVEERTSQLEEARRQADSANRAKSAFLANMSHEIRTPMNAIVGLAHILKQSGLNLDQMNQLDKIRSSSEHLLSIINDILDISRIEAGKLQLEHAVFSLESIVDQIQTLFQDPIASKGIHFEVELTDVPEHLVGDKTRLRQALFNYVGNAVKFTETGEIGLHVRKIDENDNGIVLRFEVTDTGIGIEAEKLARLFQSFEQGDASMTRKYGGSGLGLAVTRNLAQLMGGEAGAESEYDKGSCFWFTAKFGRGSDDAEAEIPTSESIRPLSSIPDLEGYRVLLVEDDAINREVAKALLKDARLEVDTAEDGSLAVEKVRKTDYDLILMDVQMPVMDGMEATRLIRTFPGAKADIPILAMTANVFEDDRNSCFKAGMNDFVAKPVSPDDFYSKLNSWISRGARGVDRQPDRG